MNLRILLGLVSVILLTGTLVPIAMAQSNQIATYVVINEVDTNPPGDDAKTISEWIELYNPTNSEVNIGGWKIAPTTGLKKVLTIPEGTTIKPNQFKTFSYQSLWFTDISERIELRDSKGNIIDETPLLSDLKNDFTSWQRIYDGYDTDSTSDWKYVTSTAGSSNGKLIIEQKTEGVSVTLETQKSEFVFDETVTISGKVSKQLFIEKPFFQAEQISLTVTGPNYFKTFTLYPDLNLGYKTTLSLQKVLGFSEGIYDVSVKYGDAVSKTQFALGTKLVTQKEAESSALSISPDREFYIPGDTVKISAKTNKIIPLEGLKWSVVDPNGKKAFGGDLYPNTVGEFSTSFRLTTVAPVFGQYKILAEYSTTKTEASFEFSKDVKEAKKISLMIDKPAYALGEKVIITGRLNQVWVPSLDFELSQVGTKLKSTDVQDLLRVLNVVRIAGDGTFSYEYQLSDNQNRLGDYRVTVSKAIGTESVFFKVVEDPENYVVSTAPLSITTDKKVYEFGNTLKISGKVSQLKQSTTFQTAAVKITLADASGNPISFDALSKESKSRDNKPLTGFITYTGVPNAVGNYVVEVPVSRSLFEPGKQYTLKATYDDKLKASTTFEVVDEFGLSNDINVKLNKDVFGLGDTVELTGIITALSQGKGISITVTKPDGDTEKFGTVADNGKFSWKWQTPKSEKFQTTANDPRSVITSNFGVYRVTVATDTKRADLFFKVSQNPLTDTLETKPLMITTDKPVYLAGEKVTVIGNAQKRVQGTQGLVVPHKATVTILSSDLKVLYESSLFLDTGGKFQATYDLPITIFKEGTYKVKSTYQTFRAETVFQVSNDLLKASTDKLTLIVDTDKNEYYPGDTVNISVRPNKLIQIEKIDLGIPREEQTKINCGAFVCGQGVPIVTLRPDQSGTFSYQHKISSKSDALGKYIVTIDAEFGKFKKEFTVVEKPAFVPPVEKPAERTIEKVNRITDSLITISVKSDDAAKTSPRVIEGSLITPTRGEEANVNLKVTSSSGVCIIGPDAECIVQKSTRGPGTIYKLAEIDGISYKIRYSGPDAKLEKFSILPESDTGIIPDSTWDVKVLKQDQASRFYYKVTHLNIE